MTKHDLIAQVGGIERAKGILGDAPLLTQMWRDIDSACFREAVYYSWCGGSLLAWVGGRWVKSLYNSSKDDYILDQIETLDDLRAAIELSGISGQLEVLEMIHVSPSCEVIEK